MTDLNSASRVGFGAAVWLSILAVMACAAAAMFYLLPPGVVGSVAPAAAAAAPGVSLGTFELESSSGEKITEKEVLGQPCVIEFFFTSCPVCALMNQGFQRLQQRLPPNVRLLSITVDPEHDTPAVLKEYAARHGADPARWVFVRGDMLQVNALIQRLALQPVTSPAEHSTRFLLVDAESRLVGSYSPVEFEDGKPNAVSDRELTELVEAAKALVAARR